MKTTKRLVALQYNYFTELEQKLEKYASKGLILTSYKGGICTFEKTEPQKLKYTVTYFDEASVFNPYYTDNQLVYFEYAKESGWDFVCENGKMQIFSSKLENPMPFDTDEEQKLNNIHTCMKKSLIFSQAIMLVLWVLNASLRFSSAITRPIDFFADTLNILTLLMFIISAFFCLYTICSHYSWYNKSKKSIALGGEIINPYSKLKKAFETCNLIFIFSIVFLLFAIMFESVNIGIIAITLLQVPLFAFVFLTSIAILKKLKVSATTNKTITFIVYSLTIVGYLAFTFFMIINFDFSRQTKKEYRVYEWTGHQTSYEYKLYNDELPLTCQDLYGENDYPNYSYEENIEKSIFLTKETYSQNSPPTKEKPPEIFYQIYRPKFDFVNNLLLKELLSKDTDFDYYSEEIDNSLFDAEKVYTFYYLENETKNYRDTYLLIYDNRLVYLSLDEELTDSQIATINTLL